MLIPLTEQQLEQLQDYLQVSMPPVVVTSNGIALELTTKEVGALVDIVNQDDNLYDCACYLWSWWRKGLEEGERS